MSDSESHEMDEQPIIYEEEEVLWAKIRGYPWWPAFVDKVHGAISKEDEELQYTVFFFGDNTHSRLGASKLRRFLDYYTEFFPKAKTNRKLYLSIMKAEQKLKQNGGNVEIFETLRNSLKKSKKGRGHHKTQSKIDSQDNINNISEEPQLIRNKTFPNHEQKQAKQIDSQQQVAIDEQKQGRKRGKKGRKVFQKEQKQEKQKKQIESQSEQDEQDDKQILQPKVLNYRTRSGRTRNQPSQNQQHKEQKSDDQKELSQQSENQTVNKKINSALLPIKTKSISRGGPKKRGRPKKIVQQRQQSDSQQSQLLQGSQNSDHNKIIPQPQKQQSQNETRKTRLERNISTRPAVQIKQLEKQKQKGAQEALQKCETSQQTKSLILERVKFCLDKRAELIEYLDDLNVTTDIVKDVLDLDVTTVLLEGGEMSQQAIKVLQKLKSVLLHKYFPDDIKIRKKYEKLTKKAQSLRTSTTETQESLDDLQLRRKTLIKLQKILRSVQETVGQKEKAIQIESYFRKYDQSIGTGYKTIAYKVLRSLKDKNYSVEEIMLKLEAGEFDQDAK